MENNSNINIVDRKNRLEKAVAYLKGEQKIKTQKDIAQKMETTAETITRALKGNEKYLTDNFLVKFAQVFSLNEDWLLTGKGSITFPKLTKLQLRDIPKRLRKILNVYKSKQATLKDTNMYNNILKYEPIIQQISDTPTIITEEIVRELCNSFPDVNFDWVWENKGNMYLSGNDFIEKAIDNGKTMYYNLVTDNGTNEVTPVPEQNYFVVEYIDLSTSAGFLGGGVVEDLPESKKRLIPREYEKGDYLVVRVSGDSMDDGTKRSLSDGDEILIRLWTDIIDIAPIRNKLFVVNTNNGSIVKQITKIDKSNNTIVCHSFNERYPDQYVDIEEILQLFTVEKIVNSKIRF